jgi:hypothetical protein
MGANDSIIGPLRYIIMDELTLRQLQTQLMGAQAFLIQHQPVVELLVMLGLYINAQSSTYQFVLSTKRAKVAGYPYKPLVFHILISVIIVGRYYIIQLFSVPIPRRLDLALELAQVASSFYMAKHTPSHDTLFKAGFQTMGAMNLVSVIITFVTGSPQWHRVMVKCVDWFTYFRLIIRAIRNHHLLGFPKVPVTALVHLVSAPITLWVADYPYGIPIYFATLMCITALNEWVSTQVPHKYILSFLLLLWLFGRKKTCADR